MPRLHLSGRACLLLYEQVAKTEQDYARVFKKNGGQKVENNELYHALQTVSNDALRTELKHQYLLLEKPLHGWTREHHEDYHKKRIAESQAVYNYCFARQMQINPD